MQKFLWLVNRAYFMSAYLDPLLKSGKHQKIILDKTNTNSRNQKIIKVRTSPYTNVINCMGLD